MSKHTEFKALTMKEVLGYCFVAMENFLKNCPHENLREAAKKMHYDIYINHRLSWLGGRAFMRGRRRGNKAGGPRGLLKNHAMELNFTLLSHMTPDERFQVTSHELAHLVDYEIRQRSGHDKPWKNIHRWMGGNFKRCYEGYDSSAIPLPNKKWLVEHPSTGKKCYLTNKQFKKMEPDILYHNKVKPGSFIVKQLKKP